MSKTLGETISDELVRRMLIEPAWYKQTVEVIDTFDQQRPCMACEKLREAIGWLEEHFRVNIDGGGNHACPWCYKSRHEQPWAEIDHAPDCVIGQALAQPCQQPQEPKLSGDCITDRKRLDAFKASQQPQASVGSEEWIRYDTEVRDGNKNKLFICATLHDAKQAIITHNAALRRQSAPVWSVKYKNEILTAIELIQEKYRKRYLISDDLETLARLIIECDISGPQPEPAPVEAWRDLWPHEQQQDGDRCLTTPVAPYQQIWQRRVSPSAPKP